MYAIYSTPYLDKIQQTYYNILTIEPKPIGNLKDMVKQIQLSSLTNQFGSSHNYSTLSSCVYALTSIKDPFKLMELNEIPALFNELKENGYNINTDITNMMNRGNVRQENRVLLCYVEIM